MNDVHKDPVSSQDDMEEEKILPKLVDDYDPDRRELAITYTRASRRFSFIMTGISFIVSLVILMSKITVELEKWINANFSEDPFIVVGVFFIIVFFILTILELPIGYYSFNKFSRKYGLSKLNNWQWLKRQFKGEIISFVLGLLLIEGFYWFLRSFPDTWWIFGTGALILFSLVLANLVPILILPRFYKFEPLKDTHPELSDSLLEMATEMKIKTTKVLNWRLGKVATVGNAAILGFGATRRIIVADTMLDKYTNNEIKWIVAHEIGHFKYHDLWRQIVIGMISTTLMFLFTQISFSSLAEILGYPVNISSISNLPVLGISFWVIQVLLTVPTLHYSRKRETAADNYASSYLQKSNVAKSLFIKMADQNLADIHPPAWEKYLFMSHPPINERIKNLMYKSLTE
ncbi:MAG: M48 family metallopeptidase [Candidatus Hodarchaeales archaeon]|jgi:STE24 endopeptidase